VSLIETLIVTSCVGLSGQNQLACNNALTAGSKQSGVETEMNQFETKVTKNAESDVRDYLGNNANVVAGGVFLIKGIADKAATFTLPNFGVCTSMKADIGQSKSLLRLEWKF
jgi:hypothetical protein